MLIAGPDRIFFKKKTTEMNLRAHCIGHDQGGMHRKKIDFVFTVNFYSEMD